MLKKYTALLLMTVAYAILLGHSIIPHHHHDSVHELTEHHQEHHQHDGEEESNGLSHLFSHFVHSADGFTTTQNNFNISFLQKQLSVVAVLPNNFYLKTFAFPLLKHKPPTEQLIYISPHFLSSGLRAPPAFIG